MHYNAPVFWWARHVDPWRTAPSICAVVPAVLSGKLRPDLPEPYRRVKLRRFDPHGMFNFENRDELRGLIQARGITTAVEVGCWLGASARHIAGYLPRTGRLYAVDHWKGSEEHQPGGSAWYRALPYLYDQFLSNVVHAGLTDRIIPLKTTSLEAAAWLRTQECPPIDLIYLDGSHDTASVLADLVAWFPLVQGHGVLCGDDWGFPTVRAAVERFADEQALTISVNHAFWRVTESSHSRSR